MDLVDDFFSHAANLFAREEASSTQQIVGARCPLPIMPSSIS
jgi:hypothetical protein